ncbi:carbohydrate esterase family 5 protein [Zasmidium cellare ATCC 36951]|uniref:Carbohydrate esterase family 5 protein n=1 Tax=Zasmidium cellare ATCC 36951 TaxID=1080233 RepID=A0A6A6CU79_ZASCE|nr:carbohydrate esterase family 5 protein [Zasmidium cellare ATCC 36951]KAF2170595.1 carbohydrate esterase family 5 protein [Zasmidium cellare ATCC 36951]
MAEHNAATLNGRQSCPNIHVFGARETTAAAGYGSSSTFVNAILKAYPGSTSEAINYPAAGGDSYASSVQQGTQNIANQINAFNKQCPSAKLVVVGYSQGAQIGDNALCGGGDPNQGVTYTNSLISSSAASAIKAVIWAGNPRNSPAESSFHVGTCTAGGFDPRPSGFTCPSYQSKIRSYCDALDPYCCNGNNATTHQGYGNEYGSNALAFVKSKLG